MPLVLVTKPLVEPLLVPDAKAMLNIGSEVSDAVMGAFVTSARQMIDGSVGWINRCLITQTWNLVLDAFPWQDYYSIAEKGFYQRPDIMVPYRDLRHRELRGIVIPLAPVQSIVSITYMDDDGDQQTLDPANYSLVLGDPARVVLSFSGAWPAAALVPGSVTVQFIAGYGDSGNDVPQAFRAAIALQASHLRSLSAQNLYIGAETVEGVGSTNYVVGSGAATAIDGAVQSLLEPYRVQLS